MFLVGLKLPNIKKYTGFNKPDNFFAEKDVTFVIIKPLCKIPP